MNDTAGVLPAISRLYLDFAVWTEGLGCFALQVKGGHYRLSDGEWHLKTRGSVRTLRSCLLDGLVEIVLSRSVAKRLSMERVALEVYAVTDGLIRLAETVEGENRGMKALPTALSLTAGGLNLIRVSVREMHLRFGPHVGLEASRKRSEIGRP